MLRRIASIGDYACGLVPYPVRIEVGGGWKRCDDAPVQAQCREVRLCFARHFAYV
jgi:hypothetical protein